MTSTADLRPRLGRNTMVDETLPRRQFLLGAGLAGATVATGLAGAPAPAAAQTPAVAVPAAAAPHPAASSEPETYLALTATEAAFLSAVAAPRVPPAAHAP